MTCATEPRRHLRGRRLARAGAAAALALALLTAWAFRARLEELWHRAWLRSEDPRRSEAAARALLRSGSTGAIPSMLRAARERGYLDALLPRMLERHRAEDLAPALPELLLAIEECSDPFVWIAVVDALKKLGPLAEPALPRLLESYPFWRLSPDFSLHHRILEILANLGPAAKEALPMLEQAIADHDLEAQRLARIAMERIRGE